MKPKNYKLTKNFSLYEYMEGQAMPNEAIKLAWQNFTPEIEEKIKLFMPVVQEIRDWVNVEFRNENQGKEIGLVITSGFRSKEWEIKQGRSGKSQHTICACDIKAVNCPPLLALDIHKAIYSRWDKVWNGGLAIKYGNINATGFIHIDPRKERKRWVY